MRHSLLSQDKVVVAFASAIAGIRLETNFEDFDNAEQPPWAVRDIITVKASAVDGALPKLELYDTLFNDLGISVTSGRFTVASSVYDASLSAEAGECIVKADGEFEDPAPTNGQMSHPIETMRVLDCR